MTLPTEILSPAIALIAWTMLMWLWMYATRIPAVRAAGLKLDRNAIKGEQMATLPSHVRWKADNYNHLMEQPTLFYALVMSLVLLGEGGETNATIAWAYVALRIIHSLFQVLSNKIEVRFVIFVLSNVPLFVLTYNAAMTVM